jgi:hypothetical protein
MVPERNNRKMVAETEIEYRFILAEKVIHFTEKIRIT